MKMYSSSDSERYSGAKVVVANQVEFQDRLPKKYGLALVKGKDRSYRYGRILILKEKEDAIYHPLLL